MSVRALEEYTRFSKYAKYLPEKKRRETWDEQVKRVFDMHKEKLGPEICEKIKDDLEFAESMVRRKRVLGSQRALQFGGKAILNKHERLYNCFRRSTEFITNKGVKSFNDFSDGEEIVVLTHEGQWKKAKIKKHGLSNDINKITFSKGSSKGAEVFATGNHTWILRSGERTTSLKINDMIWSQPNMFNSWEYDDAQLDERLYWAYGMIYGDGTKVKDRDEEYKHSMIRLCGEDKRFIKRFEELGFSCSSSHSLNGDLMAFSGTYLKTLPDPNVDDVRLLRAFVRGFLDADGEKTRHVKNYNRENCSLFKSIQQTSIEAQNFIRKVFPIVGVYIISETKVNRITNFGKHNAVRFTISTSCAGTSPIWKVTSIEKMPEEEVWCMEVEDDHSFVMPNGIVTGNCTMSHCDRPSIFQEAMFLLLCGCVLPDTKVLTENGIKEIQDILEGERVWSFNKETEDIELKSVIKTHDVHVPHDENIKVSGIYGNFTTSKKHPVLVLRENKWEYVPADSISLGDVIQKASFQNSSNKFDKKAYFAGAFLGDGSSNVKECGSRRIRINGDNEELVKVFAELMEDLSGVSVKYKEDNRSIYSVPMWIVEKTLNKENPLTQTWDSLVGKLPSSKTKVIRVPEWIRNQYNKDTFLSFLSGLIDTDGDISDGKMNISTISKKMVEDICSESTKYGIYPWVTTVAKESYCSTGFTPKNDLYRITFSINDLADAKDFFRHDKKSEKVKNYIKSTNKSHKRLVIPSEKIEEEISYLELDSNIAWHFRKQIEENNTCYASYYTSRGKSFSHLLKYDIVIDIECDLDITENFKDLSVEDNNSYICGEGSYYVLHNCGIGFSVQKRHIDKLPEIKLPNISIEKTFEIEDSIEGWADSIGVLLSSYFVGDGVPFPEYQNTVVRFDFSKIRPAGAPISSGSKAPGPDGLKNSLEKIVKLLNKCCKLGNRLKPIDVYDIMMHSSDAVLSGGIRRCIAEGQRVLVKDRGFKPIEKIVIGDYVSTNDGWKKVTNTFFQGIQKTIKINHQDGYLYCTPNHRVAVLLDHDGNHIWKMAKDLKPDDRLFFINNENDTIFKNKLPSFSYKKPLHSTTCKDIVIPELDEEMAWLLGTIHGDGYVYLTKKSGQVSIACEGSNPEKIRFIKTQIERFGVNTYIIYPSEKDNSYKVVVKSKQLASYFSKWLKKPKTSIKIPECIKKGTYSVKGAYLQGVLDSDGSIGKKCQNLVVTIYEDFAKDIQSLAYSMGICTRMRELSSVGLKEGWNKKFGVYILNNKDRILFNYSNDLGWKKFSISKSQHHSNSYPIEFFRNIEKRPKNWYKKICLSNKLISKGSWEDIFGENNITPILVKNIENGMTSKTYDIEVEDNSCFICEGVLVHNSASICLFSPEDDEMAKAKTGSWRIENPQRGRSNNSVILVRDETSKEEFMKFIKYNKEYGEPGFVWAENSDIVVNPCVSGDTWVMTSEGPKKAKNLLDEQFNAVVNGEIYPTTKKGMFKTGTKEIFSIKTKEGISLDVTKNHKIMTKNGWVELKDIKIGDEIIIHDHKELEWGEKNEEENFDNGWLLGSLVGDGTFLRKSAILDYWGESRFHMPDLAIKKIKESKFNKDKEVKSICVTARVGKKRIHSRNLGEFASRYGIEKNRKTIGDKIEESSSEMYRGFLQGYFDADGCVQGNLKKGISIRLDSISETNLEAVQRMLLRLGIVSKIYRNRREEGYRLLPDGKGGKRKYYCQAVHELVISNDSIQIYKERIGFSEPDKIKKMNKLLELYKRKQNRSKYWVTVSDIEKKGIEEVYDCTVPIVHAFDGNGMYIHNCVEISSVPKLLLNDELRERFKDEIVLQKNKESLSGWMFCNLCEINAKKAKTIDDFLDACRAASIIGTIQASYNSFKYLGGVTEEIVKAEALLGVSMTGMADNPEIAFNPSIQRKGAKLILEVNERIAKEININPCARATCIKPAGSTSAVLGTASGIHPHHAKRYFRRVQANKLETPLQYFKNHNPDAIEESVWSNNNTDVVITFLCEVPDGAKTKNQESAISMLENVKLTQQNWVEYGTRHDKAIYSWLRHNVSNTISIKPFEWQEVADHIYRNKKWYAGISMLPMSGDKDYPQAPFTAVLTTTEMVREYGDGCLFASGLIVDGLRVFDDNLWKASDCILGIGEIITVDPLRSKITKDFETNGINWKKEGLSPDSPDKLLSAWLNHNVKNYKEKLDWVRRAKQFAVRYFEGDVRKMTYCLKDVTNWKKWLDLKRTYVDVDWSGCYEDKYGNLDDYGGGAGDACAGGSCEQGDLGYSMREKLIKNNE